MTAQGHSLRLRYGVTAAPPAGVRVFSGSATADSVRMLPGATQGISSGAGITMAMIAKRTGTTGGAVMTVANNANGGTYSVHALLGVKATANGNYLYGTVNSGAGTVDTVSTIPWTAADGWCLIAFTKVAGTAVKGRLHKIPLGGAASHGDGATNQGNGQTLASTARWEFGRGEYGDWVTDKIGVAGVWNAALTDAQVEELAAHLRTSDWWNNSGGHPLALWEFNQTLTSTAIADLTGGGADQTYRNNTTVDGADLPSTWFFDGATTMLTASESITATDTVAVAVQPSMVTAGDTITATDTATVLPPIVPVTAADTVTTADTAYAGGDHRVVATDSVIAADTPTVLVTTRKVTASDTVTVTTTPRILTSTIRVVATDSIVATDTGAVRGMGYTPETYSPLGGLANDAISGGSMVNLVRGGVIMVNGHGGVINDESAGGEVQMDVLAGVLP